jgi:predicted DNA-binding transcriptional regulator AlpA
MTAATLKTLTPEDLAVLLRRSVSTIKTDCRRRPETLPPRLRIPGSTRLVWLEADVLEWLERCREKARK